MTTRGRRPKPGRFTFVGAGPGDPGLLTARAKAVLAAAALVFTDPDVAPGVLALVGSELPPASGPEPPGPAAVTDGDVPDGTAAGADPDVLVPS
jgi:uroporphyrinogen III methyltransferase/synthase